MKNLCLLIVLSFVFLLIGCKSTKDTDQARKTYNPENVNSDFRIMFYNVENLFDTENDPYKNDDEFTPDTGRYWTKTRYNEKLRNIYKVIVAVGGWDLPQIVGLSEVENLKVLKDLINYTPLYKSDYKIIHYNSPDARGIDVALLYRENYFSVISHKPIPVVWPKHIGTGTTRDILYVCGVTNLEDTLHVFVNHWPSRWGGQIETEEKRMHVAKLLKHSTDSIFKINKTANIVVMGDLNDHPTDRSLTESLQAQTNFDKIKSNKLYNLSYYLQVEKKLGTHKHQDQWGIIDQIIVSGALLSGEGKIYTTLDDAHVFNEDFLLETDQKFTGKKVKRTYIGFKYHGGYSDHLPTYVDLKQNKDKVASE